MVLLGDSRKKIRRRTGSKCIREVGVASQSVKAYGPRILAGLLTLLSIAVSRRSSPIQLADPISIPRTKKAGKSTFPSNRAELEEKADTAIELTRAPKDQDQIWFIVVACAYRYPSVT